jgi:hypothetical protein
MYRTKARHISILSISLQTIFSLVIHSLFVFYSISFTENGPKLSFSHVCLMHESTYMVYVTYDLIFFPLSFNFIVPIYDNYNL